MNNTHFYLPYKQGVTGSNPVGPTSSRKSASKDADFFVPENSKLCFEVMKGAKKADALASGIFYLQE